MDYANVINFKNVRVIYQSESDTDSENIEPYPIIQLNKKIKKGDIVNFEYPIIIDEDYLRSYIDEKNSQNGTYYNLDLRIRLNDGTAKLYSKYITVWNDQQGKYDKSGNIGIR